MLWANAGEIVFTGFLAAVFCCSILILSRRGEHVRALKAAASICGMFTGGAFLIAVGSIVILGEVGAFLIAPNFIFFLQGFLVSGLVLILPTLAICAVRDLVSRKHSVPTELTPKKGLPFSVPSTIGLTLVIGLCAIGSGLAYVHTLPKIVYANLDLERSAPNRDYQPTSKEQVGISSLFEEYLKSKFPYRYQLRDKTSFASPEEFQAYDPAIWSEVRQSLIFQFMSKLKFCTENPFLSIIPSCIYTKPGGGTYLLVNQS